MTLPVPPADLDLDLSDDAPFSREQRIWLAGYLAGARSASAPAEPEPATATPPILMLWGSETGNAEYVAEETAKALQAAGLTVDQQELNQVSPADLVGVERVLVVCSTYGEGEMPDNADLFWQAFAQSDAPRLDGTSYAVFALGDTAYDDFCQAGKLLDTRFEQLGAARLLPRVDCDVLYDDQMAAWPGALTEALGSARAVAPEPEPEPEVVAWGRRNPFPAVLAHSRRLSGPGSAKDIHHHEFALADSGIGYEAGDALAVVPRNDPALVEALLAHLGHDPAHEVEGGTLGDALHTRHEIVTPSRELLALLAERDPELRTVLNHGDRAAFLWNRDTLDLLRLADLRVEVDEFLGLLKPLQHRAYSISSSPLVAPDRIHLTVASVRYRAGERDCGGVCSTLLADRLAEGEQTGIFLQQNKAFRVPADDDLPMIMIGPGTGVAPFRAFLQERRARGATGRNWLFFGDQHRSEDFLYSDELLGWASDGLLTTLDLAFSRDQADKVYVQHRMRAAGAELYRWLEEGAHVYVCGDATHMARDVDAALHEVVVEHGGRDAEGAAAYVADLKRDKRYVRDVY
jgi:sulfite reductase (NADPH) flavoprotein alpha-component